MTVSAPDRPSAPLPVKHNPRLHDLVWDLLKSHPRGSLLDVPSGPGYFARQAQANGFNATAAEIDRSLHVFPEVRYVEADMARSLPFEEGTFDYVVSIEGIEHVADQMNFLQECFRVLKPGGRMFLTTPNVSSLKSRLLFFLTGSHDNPPGPWRSDLPHIFMTHINLIPFQRLEGFLRFAGFELERVHPYKLRPESLLLYPLVYPLAWWRYRKAFRRYYAGRPDAERYKKIFDRFLSREVMCGAYNVVVAVKRDEEDRKSTMHGEGFEPS